MNLLSHYILIICDFVPESSYQVGVADLCNTERLKHLLVDLQLPLFECGYGISREMYSDDVVELSKVFDFTIMRFNLDLILIGVA